MSTPEGSAERAARFSSVHAATLQLVQERQRARGLNLPATAIAPTEALIESNLAQLAQSAQGMADDLRDTDQAARKGRVALAEVRQAEDDLTEAQTNLKSLLSFLGTDSWAADLQSKIKNSCVALDPPPDAPTDLPLEGNAPSTSLVAQAPAKRADYYHDDIEDNVEASTALMQSQQLQMDNQDAQLDLLGQSIQRQQHLSLRMNEELGRHSELLDGLDGAVDNTASSLGAAHRRLDTFRRASREHGASFAIIGLIVLLILIIALVK